MKGLMSKLSVAVCVLAMSIGFVGVQAVAAQEYKDAQKSVDEYLKSKIRISGSLDLYDSKIDKVRNLRLINLNEKTFEPDDDKYRVKGDFRDINSGDILELEFHFMNEGGELIVDDVEIGKLKAAPKKAKEKAEKKKYTPEEAKEAMKAHIEKKSKFTGTYGLFDPKTEKLRQLELIEMDEKVRNFGVLYICTLKFKDVGTDETVVVDMTLTAKEGDLEMKTMKIKKRIKP